MSWASAAPAATTSPPPRCRSKRIAARRPWPDGTLWRLPIYTTLLPTPVAVPLGIARGPVDEVSRQGRGGRAPPGGPVGRPPHSLGPTAPADTPPAGGRAGVGAPAAGGAP